MKILILYSSRDGQTFKIARYIARVLKQQQPAIESDLRDLNNPGKLVWADYQRVLIGASVRYGHFTPQLIKFVTEHQPSLAERVSGFCSVNLTARKPEKAAPGTNSYTARFLEVSPWKPDMCAVFAGALRYPHYRWFDRFMIRLIMKITGGETDTSKEVEYTNWVAVEEFAVKFAKK